MYTTKMAERPQTPVGAIGLSCRERILWNGGICAPSAPQRFWSLDEKTMDKIRTDSGLWTVFARKTLYFRKIKPQFSFFHDFITFGWFRWNVRSLFDNMPGYKGGVRVDSVKCEVCFAKTTTIHIRSNRIPWFSIQRPKITRCIVLGIWLPGMTRPGGSGLILMAGYSKKPDEYTRQRFIIRLVAAQARGGLKPIIINRHVSVRLVK